MAQRFLTLEAAIDLLFSLPDDERESASVCRLPPVEDGNITDEEHVNENDFSEVVPDDVCGHVECFHCELHKGSDAAMTHIAFRPDVTMSLLQLKQKLTVRPGPRVHPRYEDRKTDGHYIISTTRGRCAECKKNTTNQCQQCKKRLHKKGFAAYHGL
ncbi:hypothetical protein MRX96_000254 [Rhipicephalus microplus]